MKTFLICPVRGEAADTYAKTVEALEAEGYTVHWPPRDTDQNDETGLRICQDNTAAIARADCVHIIWNGTSQGCLFDLGVAFALGKKIIPLELPPPTAGKSFQNMIRAAEIAATLSPSVASPQAVQVTDEMIRAGCRGFYGDRWNNISDLSKESALTWMRDALTYALAAQPQAQPPQDYVLVPREPTEAMLVAALREFDPIGELVGWDHDEHPSRTDIRGAWKAILAAAPIPLQESPAQSQACEPVAKPLTWLRTLHGKPDWAEDCIGDDPCADYDAEDGYAAVPLYTHPPAPSPASAQLPATGPFVDRIVRIFRGKPTDDTSALVLRDYALAASGGDSAASSQRALVEVFRNFISCHEKLGVDTVGCSTVAMSKAMRSLAAYTAALDAAGRGEE
jgi:hypothetical protein